MKLVAAAALAAAAILAPAAQADVPSPIGLLDTGSGSGYGGIGNFGGGYGGIGNFGGNGGIGNFGGDGGIGNLGGNGGFLNIGCHSGGFFGVIGGADGCTFPEAQSAPVPIPRHVPMCPQGTVYTDPMSGTCYGTNSGAPTHCPSGYTYIESRSIIPGHVGFPHVCFNLSAQPVFVVPMCADGEDLVGPEIDPFYFPGAIWAGTCYGIKSQPV